MQEKYEINKETLALLSVGVKLTKVIEKNKEYIIKQNSLSIMEESCKYFGSSMNGRIISANDIIGSKYKTPVVVDETREIIFLPTESPFNMDCNWVSLKEIENFKNEKDKTKVIFKNGKTVIVDISKHSFENQVFRASKLGYIMKSRKND